MVVKKGETGTYVKWLQQGLHIMCCYDGTIDSTFGAGTESGVKKYQGKNGLDQDGIIGCSSLFNFIVTNIIYYRFLSVASSPESAQEIFLFPHVSYALYQ